MLVLRRFPFMEYCNMGGEHLSSEIWRCSI
nr:MAG TPA: hypothetical protein [Caudoviricetes sp.]